MKSSSDGGVFILEYSGGAWQTSGNSRFHTNDTYYTFDASQLSGNRKTYGDYLIYVTNNNSHTIDSNQYPFTYGPSPPVSNTCFPGKTPIVTDQGIIAIEKLDKSVYTIRGKPIVAITKTVNPDKYLVCFEKDALATNVPSKKTVMSKNHCVFYKGNMMPAKSFLYKFDQVFKVKYTGESLYNVFLDNHDKMMVNNLICETLHPESKIANLYQILASLKPEQQQEAINQWNEYIAKLNSTGSKKATK
jgi:hypothetical protein